jgi:Flp pilus assembly pilin Flp
MMLHIPFAAVSTNNNVPVRFTESNRLEGVNPAIQALHGGLSVIVIPAVTTLVGSIMGVLTGKKIGNWFKSGQLRAAQIAFKERATSLRNSFVTNCDGILKAVRKGYASQDKKFRAAASRTQDWLERLLTPTVMTKFYSMARRRTKTERLNTEKFYTALRNECKKQEDETTAGLIIYAQGREVFSFSEAVQNAWDKVNEALQAVEREKARLA